MTTDAGHSPVALTGTPGTGKSRVGALLRDTYDVIEVGAWALHTGYGRRRGASVTVAMAELTRAFRRLHRAEPHEVYVGHLAHLLPIRDVVVLRCHPRELGRRLGRARRGSPRDRQENAVAEALDLILLEALAPGRRVWEIDTTGRSPSAVAREVSHRLARRGPTRAGRVRWLEDPSVTDYLLEQAP